MYSTRSTSSRRPAMDCPSGSGRVNATRRPPTSFVHAPSTMPSPAASRVIGASPSHSPVGPRQAHSRRESACAGKAGRRTASTTTVASSPRTGRHYRRRLWLASVAVPSERDLFANFERMRREMDELFGDVLDRGLSPRRRGGFSPAVDVYYTSDSGARGRPRGPRRDRPRRRSARDPGPRARALRPPRARGAVRTTASTSSSRSSAGRSGASSRSGPRSTRTAPTPPTRMES